MIFFLKSLYLVGDIPSAPSSFEGFERVKGSGVCSDSLVSQLTSAGYVLSSDRQEAEAYF